MSIFSGIMNRDITQLLIAEIKNYPELYDKKKVHNKGLESKRDIWGAIGAKVGLSGDVAKKRWRYIRDAFILSIKRRKQKGEGAIKIKPYKYEKDLDFLVPHLPIKETGSTLDIELMSHVVKGEVDSHNEITILGTHVDYDPDDSEKEHETTAPPIEYIITHENDKGKHIENRDSDFDHAEPTSRERHFPELQSVSIPQVSRSFDLTDAFFLNLAAMVKELPVRTQSQIKFELYKRIYNAGLDT